MEDDSPEGKVESPEDVLPSISDLPQQQYQPVPLQSPESYSHPPEQHLALVRGNSGMIPNAGHPRQMAAQPFNGHPPFFQPGPEPHPMDMISPEITSYPNTSPTNVGTDFSQPLTQMDGYLPDEFNFIPPNSGPRIVGMVEGGVDWLNLEFESPNNGDLQAQYQSGGIPSLYPQPPMPNGLGETFQARAHQAIAAGLMPIRNHDTKGTIQKSSEPPPATHQWPFDHDRNHNPETQKLRLPPLRDILQGAPLSNQLDNGAIVKSLIQLMSTAYLTDVDISHDLSMMSAMDLLKNALDLYFSEFHAVLPLVHVPTFQMNKVPTVTLAAMACIGAMYSDEQHGTEESWSLSEICIQMIACLVGLLGNY